MFRVILHYRRARKDYQGWGLHVWGATVDKTAWRAPLLPFGEDEFGIFWVVRMAKGAEVLHYILHRGEEKDFWEDQVLDINETGREIWLIESSGGETSVQYLNPADAIEALDIRGVGDVRGKAQAYWLSADTIAWHIGFNPDNIHRLHFAAEGGIDVSHEGIGNCNDIPLVFTDKSLNTTFAEKYPHLRHAAMLKIPAEYRYQIADMLKGQCVVSLANSKGKIIGAAALQIAGVLDDLYAYNGKLGVCFENGAPTLRVWAPTAKAVSLHLYDRQSKNGEFTEIDESPLSMIWNAQGGTWEIQGDASWKGLYYLYEVSVFMRQAGSVVNNLVTDPYSVSLSLNSTHSQIIDIRDASLYPKGWDAFASGLKQAQDQLPAPTDSVLYELHLRDFSANDLTVAEEERGTFLAFTHFDTDGMCHLKRLAEAGVTHIHLLPVFDFASVNEDKVTWIRPDFELLASYPANSYKQQAVLARARGRDGYNWGYDPYHYMTPEGSYAKDGEGEKRILEFREMVLGLYKIGLRVVLDVVFNHTYAAGLDEKSVFDKIVPGYYYRLDNDGQYITSTCCPNTASENYMMEKLMIDSLCMWAVDYQVHGFRFDLMGHHMRRNMLHIRQTLDNLSPDEHGVDGKGIYVYGEGWDFGEVAGNARGVNATQWNMQGSGIGTFNDRIREALRGGGPFDGKQEQGVITGLYTNPNENERRTRQEQLADLLAKCDKVKVGLAGNLANYELVDAHGFHVCGAQVGPGCGYTRSPQEHVPYISAHDNETLFDAIQYKAPLSASIDERLRMQNLGISFIALSQGVPFFHAGCELLRSKSMDRDSFDSGDWFNKLDFTYNSNNWGVGLPPQNKNEANWQIISDLLLRQELAPRREHILACLAHFEEMLRIRKSSPLFRLRRAGDIMSKVHFINYGAQQIPGLIGMILRDDIGVCVDDCYDLIGVFFNVSRDTQVFSFSSFSSPLQIPSSSPSYNEWTLHPLQEKSTDVVVRSSRYDKDRQEFVIPGLTTAVFIQRKEQSE